MSYTLFDPLASEPAFVSRFATHHHPEREKIVSNVQRLFLDRWPWTSEEAKLSYLEKDLEDLGLLCFPTAPEDRAEIGVALLTFLFLYDDMLEEMYGTEAKKSFTRLAKVISGDEVAGAMTPIESLAYNLVDQVMTTNDPASRVTGQSIVIHTMTYLKAAGSKQARMKSLSLDFDEFLKYRSNDAGSDLTFAITFWARGLVMPSWLSADEVFQNLTHVAGGHGVLVNDLYSYRVERKRAEETQGGFSMYDSLSFLLQKSEISLMDAMANLKERILKQEELYMMVLERLKDNHSDLLEHLRIIENFSNALTDVIGGNFIWSGYCGRYNSVSENKVKTQ